MQQEGKYTARVHPSISRARKSKHIGMKVCDVKHHGGGRVKFGSQFPLREKAEGWEGTEVMCHVLPWGWGWGSLL